MAEEVAVFSKEKAELILEVIDYLVKAGYILKSGQKGEVLESVPQLYFWNTSGETVPAYGVMEVKSAGGRYLEIGKPTTQGKAWVINSHRAVPNNQYGIAQSMPYMSALGSLNVGNDSYCGADPGSWTLRTMPSGSHGPWVAVGGGIVSGTTRITASLGFDVRWSDALGGWSIDKTFNAQDWREVVATSECST